MCTLVDSKGGMPKVCQVMGIIIKLPVKLGALFINQPISLAVPLI